MMYVIQIKQRFLRPDGTPRMAPIIMNYSLGEHTDRAFLYRHRQELGSFFTNCQVLGIVPLDSLDAAEQESVKSHLKIAKERPEFPQYQILQYLEAMAQAEKQTTPARKRESAGKTAQKTAPKRRHRITNNDLEKARKQLEKTPTLDNKQICTLLGVNENCAGFNADGTKKKLRVVIDSVRESQIGACYLTGEKQDEAADAFLQAHLSNKFPNDD